MTSISVLMYDDPCDDITVNISAWIRKTKKISK